jgi:spore photoproduct lyase
MNNNIIEKVVFKGDMLKPCPGTRGYICCGYQILNIGTNCPLDCSYCILQAYFKDNRLKVFSNLKERIGEVVNEIENHPERIYRIGTGEFTDSLALDPLTGWTSTLLPIFSERKNAVLELKTKTVSVKGILESTYRDRIIVSWSLNSPLISETEERRAPSLEARLQAARECQKEGFTLGFHFDPLVTHKDWKAGYLKTIELLDKYINPAGIIWLSLGSFRFMPALKPIIRKRHPQSCILNGEFILAMDGKMRYFKPLRIELYEFMRTKLESWYGDLGLYLCMESDDVWKRGMGWSPGDSDGLASYLDSRVRRFFK